MCMQLLSSLAHPLAPKRRDHRFVTHSRLRCGLSWGDPRANREWLRVKAGFHGLICGVAAISAEDGQCFFKTAARSHVQCQTPYRLERTPTSGVIASALGERPEPVRGSART